MWTGNAPPPLPPSALKKGNNRRGTPKPRDDELEALRQRGLTTLLNRHFTETTQKVALERAAADAAMADLQARKAQTSEFVPSKDGELSPLDALYVKVNQWQKETRKKERETLLLYQRYVNKFGASGHVQVPVTPAAASGSGAAAMVTPSTPSWATHAVDTTSPDSMYSPPAAPPPVTPTYVPTIAKKIEQALTEYLDAGGMELPSMELLGKDQTYQEVFAKHEAEFKNYYRRQLESRGVDAKTSLRWSQKTPQEREDAVYKGPGATITNNPLVRNLRSQGIYEPQMSSTPEEQGGEDDAAPNSDVFASRPCFVNEDFDDRSLVSGLTTLNSAETRRVLQDCERSVATFLRDEHEAIKRMMEEAGESDDSNRSSGKASDMGSIAKAADQAEHLVKEMQQILDDFTVSSQRMMMMPDEEEEDADTTAAQKAGGRRYHTSNPDEYWVAYYDEAYQREYYHERNTNRTQWDPPDVDTTSQSNSQSSPDDLLYEHVMPESPLRGVDGTASADRRGSRFEEYRRKQRRARKRRVMVAAAVAAVAVTAGVSRMAYAKYGDWLLTRPETAVNKEAKDVVVDLAVSPVSLMDTLRILETERWQLFEEEQQRLHRPWICNLPFAYVVHHRCRRLAYERPMFDLQALINAMLQ